MIDETKIIRKMEEILMDDMKVFRGSSTNKTDGLRLMYKELTSFIREEVNQENKK